MMGQFRVACNARHDQLLGCYSKTHYNSDPATASASRTDRGIVFATTELILKVEDSDGSE